MTPNQQSINETNQESKYSRSLQVKSLLRSSAYVAY